MTTKAITTRRKLADLHELIGKETGISRWIVVDQNRIDGLAEITGDRQYMHVGPVRAAHSPFGTTIAHGLLTSSLMGEMKEDFRPGNGRELRLRQGSISCTREIRRLLLRMLL